MARYVAVKVSERSAAVIDNANSGALVCAIGGPRAFQMAEARAEQLNAQTMSEPSRGPDGGLWPSEGKPIDQETKKQLTAAIQELKAIQTKVWRVRTGASYMMVKLEAIAPESRAMRGIEEVYSSTLGLTEALDRAVKALAPYEKAEDK